MFGDVRELIIHYFLADDTMEIREVIRANSGRDAAPKFLNRSKVPKVCLLLREIIIYDLKSRYEERDDSAALKSIGTEKLKNRKT